MKDSYKECGTEVVAQVKGFTQMVGNLADTVNMLTHQVYPEREADVKQTMDGVKSLGEGLINIVAQYVAMMELKIRELGGVIG